MLWSCFRFRPTTARILSVVVLVLLIASLVLVVVRDAGSTNDPDVVDRRATGEATLTPTGSGSGDRDPTAAEWSVDTPMIEREPEVASRLEEADPASMTFVSLEPEAGPTFAVRHVLGPLGVRVVARQLPPFCHVTDGARSDPAIGDRTSFWRRYGVVLELGAADGFLYFRSATACADWLAPFRKSSIVVIDDRYDGVGGVGGGGGGGGSGGHNADRKSASGRLVELAADAGNVVVTTSDYVSHYVSYASGLSLPVVPYACDYVTERYRPSRASYLLLAPTGVGGREVGGREVGGREVDRLERLVLARFADEASSGGWPVRLESAVSLYGRRYRARELVRHAGLVLVPRRLSSLALTELLRLDMPMFVPSVELLVRWHGQYGLLAPGGGRPPARRSEPDARTEPENGMAYGGGLVPDPNDDENDWAVGYWATYADYYQWPNVRQYDSVEGLAAMLNSTSGEDLYYASQRAAVYNGHQKANAVHFWKAAVERLRSAGKDGQTD